MRVKWPKLAPTSSSPHMCVCVCSGEWMGRSKEFREEGEGAYCKQVRGGGCCDSSIWACHCSLYCRYTTCHICLFWWILTDCPFAVWFQALGWRKGFHFPIPAPPQHLSRPCPFVSSEATVKVQCKANSKHCTVWSTGWIPWESWK